MPKIIAIDSSTEACSVALHNQGELVSRYELAPRKHAELLLPMVDSVLKEAGIELTDLDAIARSVGPGAFTGLRIAISVAQGLSFAAKLPCIGISSLQILAAEAFIKSDVSICLTSIDARMQEVYFSVFKRGAHDLPEVIHTEEVNASKSILLSPALITQLNGQTNNQKLVAKVGTGWEEYCYCEQIETLLSQPIQIKHPKAEMMLSIALHDFQNNKLLKPAFLQPVYLRNNVAKKKSQQK